MDCHLLDSQAAAALSRMLQQLAAKRYRMGQLALVAVFFLFSTMLLAVGLQDSRLLKVGSCSSAVTTTVAHWV